MIRTIYGDYNIVNKQDTFWGVKGYKEFDLYQQVDDKQHFVTHVVGNRDDTDAKLIRNHIGDFQYE